MVASIYRPLSVKTFVGLQVISDTFVVKIFDRKSCNSFIFSIVVHSLIHLFCFNTIKRSNICVGNHRNTTDFHWQAKNLYERKDKEVAIMPALS